MDFAGLEPGLYRLRVIGIDMGGECQLGGSYLDDLLVFPYGEVLHGSGTDRVDILWQGEFEEGRTHSFHFVEVDSSGTFSVRFEGDFYETIWISGLQLEKTWFLSPFGFGDGTGGDCPCANIGGPGRGCANSTGNGARVIGHGSTSLSQADLSFVAVGLPPDQPGLLFVGTSTLRGGLGVPFGDGLRCVGGEVVRLGVRVAGRDGGAEWGAGVLTGSGLQVGDSVGFQVWYRDPAGGPCAGGFNLTQGIQAYLMP